MNKNTKLTGTVIYPNDPEYQQARMNWNPFTNAFPIVFVFAHQDEDVANAVKWARENNVPIRMRSGRHALAKDFSQTNGGIVIDTSQMRNVMLDKTQGIATVQAGIRVGPLVRMLAQEGVLAPFGDSSTVGIGGISTGGGITVIQRTAGLISDNILAATIVDANGEMLRASENENPDLFWAIRGGGGGNFGIITSYTFTIRPAPFQVGIFEIIWPWEQLDRVVDVWQRWSPSVDERLGTILEIFSKANGLLRSQGIFLGPKAELEKLIMPLTDVGSPIKVLINEVTLPEAIEFWAPNEPLFDNQNTTWSSAWVEQILPTEGINSIRSFLEKAKGSESNFFFLNSGGAMNRVPPEDTAFFWRNTKYYMEWDASWTEEAETQKNIKLVEQTRIQLQPYITGSYVNVPDLNLKSYGQEYYGDNFARLRKVKAKYDPENIFKFIQSIPPAPVCDHWQKN
ncbi:FAD-binding oxidoreductase [Desulfosporosinus fructosivorans]|uniref:FAD-binding oxidoreductase n=1 Tax=Desulfosporosinus fructosivorans TaxID=2018669 RepID=A0A4Z0R0J3_9FIRM|nr:FAD-binding oxidoreductase [Desulfosporosinus fructosivorans]TGE36260.1 FAD-binding oxidoreductase [Desulfosporosinus fructosivorans]